MAKSIKEMVEDAIKEIVDDRKIVVKDDDGHVMQDLSVTWADDEDEEFDDSDED
jgi:hypothetical protein